MKKPSFRTIKITSAAHAQLDEIRTHLARRLGAGVSLAQAATAAIETLHRIQLDPDIAITNRATLAELGRQIADRCNANNARAVVGAVTELTGIEPELEVSPDGKYYTIRHGGKAIQLADSVMDLPLERVSAH